MAAPFMSSRVDFNAVVAWANANARSILSQHYGVQLNKAGRAPCVLHGGKGLNFSLFGEGGWNCHSGCGEGGDIADFVRRYRYGSLPRRDGRMEALRELAELMGGAPQWTPPSMPVVKADELEQLRADGLVPNLPSAIYETVCNHRLSLGERGAAYMESRGLDADKARDYGFRSIDTLAEWDELRTFLGENYLPPEIRNAGLARFPWWGNAPALVIPYTVRGRVLGLRFRNLKDDASHGERYRDLSGASAPLPFNADALEAKGDLWVVEGEMNAYTLQSVGIRAVGVPGAGGFRHEWLGLITEAVKPPEVIVAWYDNDPAGKSGLQKLAKWFPRGRGTLVVTISSDANELHVSGELRELVQQVKDAR